jgi:hypothetical protein
LKPRAFPFLPLLSLLLVLAPAIVLAQQPQSTPPPSPQQTPAPPQAATPSTQQPPAQPPPAPTTPPVPMVPIMPKDPHITSHLTHAIDEENSLQKQIQDFIQKGNQQLASWQAQQQAFEKIAQDEITDIKKQEGWGPEVQFNRQTGRFEKPLKRAPESTEKEKK